MTPLTLGCGARGGASRNLCNLLAKIEPSVGASDRRAHRVTRLEILRAPELGRNEQFPEPPFGQQLQNAADHRRRQPQGAAARGSGQQDVSRGNIGERSTIPKWSPPV